MIGNSKAGLGDGLQEWRPYVARMLSYQCYYGIPLLGSDGKRRGTGYSYDAALRVLYYSRRFECVNFA
jgi:hypothetical protein